MRWLLAGASGFLGTALRIRLAEEGHEVVRLVRREPAATAERQWDPDAGTLADDVLDGVDVVVDLGGVPAFTGRWTAKRRKAIVSSRVNTTSTLARALARRGSDAPVLIQASGISVYGTESGDVPYTEASPAATDWFAQVVVSWEAAAQPAVDAGSRVVLLRTSPVLDASGGAFVPMKLAWSLGTGATFGDGRQRMPLISLDDYLGVVFWAAGNADARGPYNLTIPEPTTNAAFSDALARALHRPRVLKAPTAVVRAALGEMAEQLVGDVYVVPQRLLDEGYSFVAPDVTRTVAAALARD